MRGSLVRIGVVLLLLSGLCAAAPRMAQAAEDKILNVYNWSDYIAADTLGKFTKETGIKVNYDVYDSNETLFAKLQAGQSGYDVVFPSASPFLAQGVRNKIFRPIERARLPHWSGLDSAILKALDLADPGNQYGVPYLVAATGIGYNIDKIKALIGGNDPPDSWSLLFDPKQVAKLKDCGVSLLDTSTEVFPAALVAAGHKGDSVAKDDIQRAVDTVMKVRPFIKYFHSSKYINDLANGDTCVAHGYVGDLVQSRNRAREAGKGVHLRVYIPKEGAVLNVDVAAIPADAPHPMNAHLFIDFLMRPEIIADITNTVGYANAVPAARALVRKDILDDPAIYPPPAIAATEFELPAATPEFERLRTRAWTKVKTGL